MAINIGYWALSDVGNLDAVTCSTGAFLVSVVKALQLLLCFQNTVST